MAYAESGISNELKQIDGGFLLIPPSMMEITTIKIMILHQDLVAYLDARAMVSSAIKRLKKMSKKVDKMGALFSVNRIVVRDFSKTDPAPHDVLLQVNPLDMPLNKELPKTCPKMDHGLLQENLILLDKTSKTLPGVPLSKELPKTCPKMDQGLLQENLILLDKTSKTLPGVPLSKVLPKTSPKLDPAPYQVLLQVDRIPLDKTLQTCMPMNKALELKLRQLPENRRTTAPKTRTPTRDPLTARPHHHVLADSAAVSPDGNAPLPSPAQVARAELQI
ncbi:hypothetical protein MAR_027873 [Mya arenaria]|uniref:Uncharacterized protein n=1 Tax=Mya arenaria TaxID=6604 RepID=A0ABY7DE39_MYAAR|nr:hypothetical protein MAR_027873 [Mya arenaria]